MLLLVSTARVQFSSKNEAGACVLKLKTVGGAAVKALLLDAKAARVIVRNMSFKTNEESLRKAAADCGAVTEVCVVQRLCVYVDMCVANSCG
jgi:hypothetical protein